MNRTLTAVVRREGDIYVASCPEVGIVSQGPTIEEAVGNLREATRLYLEEFGWADAGGCFVTPFEVTLH